MRQATELHDRDVMYRRRFDKMQREYLRTLVTPEIIEEHRRSPQGQHSEPLERLLIYFRRQPLTGQYALMLVEPSHTYRIVCLSGQRGVAPQAVDGKFYNSPAEAYHGVFLRRLGDLLES